MLYDHQKKFALDYRGPNLIVHEGGTGKTICACLWLADRRDQCALVICPKKVVLKWRKALKDWNTDAVVMSKEDFKKTPAKRWSAVVIDEADEFASPLFVAKSRSKLSASLYELLRLFPDTPRLLLTATPIRSTPWNLHTLLCLSGHYIDWKAWRERFFDLTRMPYLPRPAYIPKKNWRTLIRPTLEKYADIVLLKDCVSELPPVIEEKVKIKTPPWKQLPESKVFFDEHRHEQQNKAEEIIAIGKEYRKVLVVAYYREQIKELEKSLSKDKPTFAIHGGESNQEEQIRLAAESDDCYFIVQADIGAGFDADTFSCVVFASMSYAVRSYVQMKFRVRRIHNLHPVKYIYLIGGRCDRAVLSNIEKGKDFVPSEWNNATTTTQEE